MHSLIFQRAGKCIAHRYIILVIFVCSAFSAFAQHDISQRIYDVLISKNTRDCKVLMQQIKESDIVNLPDSTLLDYYYLAGWYSYENNNLEKRIEYLEKAKDICETRLGIDNYILAYFDIVKALGEACEDLGRDDEALLWYEEGIIKGLPYFDTEIETLKTYLNDILNNTADIYEKKGFYDIAEYLRNDKPLDFIGSFDYAQELLRDALKLSYENKCKDAIKLLDEAQGIFKKYGNEGKEMMGPLYRVYLRCYAFIGDTKKINELLRTKSKIMFYDGTKSYLVGDMYEVISTFILNHCDINTAEFYYQKLLNEIENTKPEDSTVVAEIGNSIKFFKNIYSRIDSLENAKKEVKVLSYEWGIASLQQSNLLISIQRYDDANEICEQVYEMSVNLKDDPRTLHWAVLMNLADYNLQNKNFTQAERYLREQMRWLDSREIPLDDEERGWIYNKLGIVYLNSNRYNEGEKSFDKAEHILLPIYGYKSQEYATILHNKGRLYQLEGNLDKAKSYLEQASQIQIELNGRVSDKTAKYLDEVNHAIDVRL